MRRLVFGAGAAALASFVAAGLAPAALPAAPMANACKLFTAADATAALRAPVKPGVFVPLGSDQSCRYSTANIARTVVVSFHPLARADWVKLVEADDLKPLPGLGPLSYEAPSGGVSLWKNGIQTNVLVIPPGTVTLAGEKKLALTVTARL